jgi:hypothetical protein
MERSPLISEQRHHDDFRCLQKNFNELSEWFINVKEKNRWKITNFVVGNKIDNKNENVISKEEAESFTLKM